MPGSYLKLYKNKTLFKRKDKAFSLLEKCSICPRRCRINRIKGQKGFCRVGRLPIIYSYAPHFGEEPPISGTNGSGTIFFSYCNMSCLYCQNYHFSQLGEGHEVTIEQLASHMIELQKQGVHNINLVTPTHFMPQILEALCIAIKDGLEIPLVYNTSGYELPENIKLLGGIIDIYLVDMRYSDEKNAVTYSRAAGYPKYNQASVIQMHKQVGIAKFDENGIMKKGVIIRHLVLPNDVSETDKVLRFIAKKISKDSYVSLMSQYTPYHKAKDCPNISHRISLQEYNKAKDAFKKYGLHNGWVQEDFGLERLAGVHIKPNEKII